MQIYLTLIDVFTGIRKRIEDKTDFAVTAKSSGDINTILVGIACISIVHTLIDVCDGWMGWEEKLLLDDKMKKRKKFVDSYQRIDLDEDDSR